MLLHSRSSSGQKELTDIRMLWQMNICVCPTMVYGQKTNHLSRFKTDFDQTRKNKYCSPGYWKSITQSYSTMLFMQ